MSNRGRAAVGRVKARFSRSKGKHGGHTAEERTERLRAGREAARDLIEGTRAKNQSTDSNNGG